MVQSDLRQHQVATLCGPALVAGRVAAADVRVHAGVDVFRCALAIGGRAVWIVSVGFAPNRVYGEATALFVSRNQMHAVLKKRLRIRQPHAAIGPAHVPGSKRRQVRNAHRGHGVEQPHKHNFDR